MGDDREITTVSGEELLGPYDANYAAMIPPVMGKDAFAEAARKMREWLQNRRERLCEAWIAETGLKPSESVLVQKQAEDGTIRIWVERKREDDKMER